MKSEKLKMKNYGVASGDDLKKVALQSNANRNFSLLLFTFSLAREQQCCS
jgi:hypothetical protein